MTETLLIAPQETLRRARARLGLVLLAWLIAIALATMFDGPVAARVHSTTIRGDAMDHWVRHNAVITLFKWAGTYWCTLILAGAACFLHRLKWQAGGFMCLSGLPGLIECLGKWVFGRIRPFRVKGSAVPLPFHLEPFRHPRWLEGLWTQENLAFPSGHATIVFAAAAAAAMLWPKWRWGFYTVAILVAVERVAENAHWVSDVVAGAALGVLGMRAVAWYCARKFPSPREGEAQAEPVSVNHE